MRVAGRGELQRLAVVRGRLRDVDRRLALARQLQRAAGVVLERRDVLGRSGRDRERRGLRSCGARAARPGPPAGRPRSPRASGRRRCGGSPGRRAGSARTPRRGPARGRTRTRRCRSWSARTSGGSARGGGARRATGRCPLPACIVASAPDQNGSPTTAASCRTERWADVSASSRAAISPWIVSGRAIDETSAIAPWSASIRTNSSAYNGLPPALATSGPCASGGSTLRTSSSASRRCMSSSVSGDSVTVDEFGLPAPQSRRTSNSSGRAVPTSSSGTSWRCSPS